MNFDLRETARDHRIIVAHRGVFGGNIPCNTIPSYETALLQGADMIETDLDMTGDGKLVMNYDQSSYLKVQVSVKQVTGTITQTSGSDTIYIDGVAYKISNNLSALISSGVLFTMGAGVIAYSIRDLIGRCPRSIFNNKYSWFINIINIILGTVICLSGFIYWIQF